MALTGQLLSYLALGLSVLFCIFAPQLTPCVFPILHKHTENIKKQFVTHKIHNQRGKIRQKLGCEKSAQKAEIVNSEPWLPHLRSTPATTEQVTNISLGLTSDNPLYTYFSCVWNCLPTNKPRHLLTLLPT